MHWIQREILKRLSTADALRYKDLKPEGVDGNLFMYHLKQLIVDGYIKKIEGGYALGSSGKSFVGGMSLAQGKLTKVPRLFVLIFAKNNIGEYLLYKWKRQPYLGHVGLPFSRLKYGQSVFREAKDTLKYKTGLMGELSYAGDVYVMAKKDGEVTTHYLTHVFKLTEPVGEPAADGLTGAPFWGNLKDCAESDLVNGTKEIIEIVENKKSPFFEEIIVDKH